MWILASSGIIPASMWITALETQHETCKGTCKSTPNKVLNHCNCILVQHTPFGIWFIYFKKLNGRTLWSEKKRGPNYLGTIVGFGRSVCNVFLPSSRDFKNYKLFKTPSPLLFPVWHGCLILVFPRKIIILILEWFTESFSSLQNSAEAQRFLLRPSCVRERIALSSAHSCTAKCLSLGLKKWNSFSVTLTITEFA